MEGTQYRPSDRRGEADDEPIDVDAWDEEEAATECSPQSGTWQLTVRGDLSVVLAQPPPLTVDDLRQVPLEGYKRPHYVSVKLPFASCSATDVV